MRIVSARANGNVVLAAAFLIWAAPVSAQQTVGQFQRELNRQLTATAGLDALAKRRDSVMPVRYSSLSAPLVGAVIGAVALPVALIVILHSRDTEGEFSFPIALIGAFLGMMVGLSVKRHS